MPPTYAVTRGLESPELNAVWDKPCWLEIPALRVDQAHGASSAHRPVTRVKLTYDENALYVIFQVQADRLRATTTRMHGPVWQDSCVEFFFAPYREPDSGYYNLEINCCGVLLMQHHTAARQGERFLEVETCQHIAIVSSVKESRCEEADESRTWVLEYRLPFLVFAPDSAFIAPAPGVTWRANLYKCADASAWPHWLSWASVDSEQPDFHRPDAFGTLQFV